MPVRILLILAIPFVVSGCAVVTVADAAVTVVATGVKVVAKTTGAVVDAAIPDNEDDDGNEG
ncbi:NF038104 family lipoprotein [Haliea sp. E1-2-M8]|uniref:NF038104 family lipoprotein n=1 Tax=Haliea sp. E1-2-M8 TaxID=3064706 RepID=UPI00271F141E|nr:NF038104 family lipoprotein [Haliea sp. E1-2-M8]MDO8863466.1 NF038104 family lipoprotein [Haliea sp. E1-2-M8]